MTSVTEPALAMPAESLNEGLSDKEMNFRRVEASREAEREARLRAEMKAEQMHAELQQIKAMLQPRESDPLEGVEDFVDAKVLRAKLEKERNLFKKEAKEIALQTVRQEREEEKKRNWHERLQSQFPDFDQVMTDTNLAYLEKADPVFCETVLEVQDDYSKRLKTYKKLKTLSTAQNQPSIKEKIEENAKNPYFIAGSVPTGPYDALNGVDFDVGSRAARDKAYAKLKSAQKNLGR